MITETRTIYRSGEGDSLQRLLEGICIAELLAPSKELYIYAAWITDFVVLDNRRGTISGLAPELPQDKIRLSEWLQLLAYAGTQVRLRTNKDVKNNAIRDRIAYVSYGLPQDRMLLRMSETLHDKGMVGDGYYLRGSFNYTKNGVLELEEHGEYNTDAQTVNTARMQARADWEGQA